MDKSIRIAVALTICHIVSGRSYLPQVRHEEYHQGYDYPKPGKWHNGRSAWDHSQAFHTYQQPGNYRRDYRDFNPHKHLHDDRESWRPHHIHHSFERNPGSWEYPDFPDVGNPSSWGHHGWGNHERPNQWPHHPPGSPWNNGPTWNKETPSTSSTVQQPQTSPRGTTTGSQDPLAIKLCIRSCPVTSEFNPVCGSNNVTYGNPGRLECAKYCGVDVSLQRNSACPPPGFNNTASQNQTNVEPTQPTRPTFKPFEPTRFTTIEIPATTTTERPTPVKTNPPFTISPDILNDIFNLSTTTEDDDADIDIRTRSRQPFHYEYPRI